MNMSLCVCVRALTRVRTHAQRPKEGIKDIPSPLSTCSFEAEFLSEPRTQNFLARLEASERQCFSDLLALRF